MASSLTGIRKGLATAMDAVVGVQASAYALSQPSPPVVQVWPDTINFHKTSQDGTTEFDLIVDCFVPFSSDTSAQAQLDSFLEVMDALSIKQAIEADSTLGGACDDLIVRSVGEYGVRVRPDGNMLGCKFHLTVIGSN